MKKLWIYLVIIAMSLSATHANAYSLDAARDSTIGNTQAELDKRGSVECISCHAGAGTYSGVMNTFEISEATMAAALSCMQWELRGICVWLACVGPICTANTTVKVKNHVPDLVIQAYDKGDVEPWTESHDINIVSQGDADSSWVTTIIGWIENFNVGSVGIRGGISTEADKGKHANLNFKIVDAYGNPSLIAFNLLTESTFGLACSGRTFPFFPYFISNLDSIAWRWDIPEMFYPQSLVPMVTVYDLGTPYNNYGAIYPRHGFMTAQDPLKAAVLAAFRAAHIITRNLEPHLYYTVGQPATDGYWPYGPLDQNDSDTGEFQMLYPKKDTSCAKFPYSGDPSITRRSSDGSYIWNFWKAYKCCKRQGQKLIYHTG